MTCGFQCTSLVPPWFSLFLSILLFFDAVVNKILFLNFSMDCSLLLDRNAADFWMLLFFLFCNFCWICFNGSNSFLWVFSVYDMVNYHLTFSWNGHRTVTLLFLSPHKHPYHYQCHWAYSYSTQVHSFSGVSEWISDIHLPTPLEPVTWGATGKYLGGMNKLNGNIYKQFPFPGSCIHNDKRFLKWPSTWK